MEGFIICHLVFLIMLLTVEESGSFSGQPRFLYSSLSPHSHLSPFPHNSWIFLFPISIHTQLKSDMATLASPWHYPTQTKDIL